MHDEDLLRPYVPGFVVDWLRTTPAARHRSVDGSLAFVDVSGFTRLTERLAARGKVGAEEMTELLDGAFDALLSVAYAHGAWLVKWGGDAVLLLFQGDGHAVRACTAAVEMRRTMDVVGRLRTSCGPVRLRVSTGVHSGRFDLFLVGRSHLELVITGPGATETARAEAAAAAGQVAVTSATAALLPNGAVRSGPDGLRLLARSPGSPPAPHRTGAPASGVDLASCLPAPTRRHLLGGGDDGDHRLVAVAFVEFSGVDALLQERGPAGTADALDALVRTCQDACTRHGVSFWETDISADGGKIMLVAGAPGGTGDEEDALLAVTRAVVEADGSLPVRVGVNSGRVFFGGFGPAYRRTLSVKGDAVNLAARLTARAAPGQVLAAASVLARARTSFAIEPLAPFRVKGKGYPVHACLVGAPVAAAAGAPAADRAPVLGREEELAHLSSLWRAALAGHLQVCEVVGEAGAGTSRLVRELAARAVADGGALLEVRCDPWTATTSYVPLRRALRRLLGAAADAPAPAVGDVLRSQLALQAPDLLPWAPLIATVVDAEVPPTPESTALDERFRAARRDDATADLLLRLLPGPTLVVVEDAHLLDPASAGLLARLELQAEPAPLLVLRCRRDEDVEPAPGRLVVAPLDASTSLSLLHALTEARPLPPHLADLLVRRSGGNPLFLTQLAAAAHTSGAEELPTSVEGVVAARIDRLDPADRRLLRTAAVLGVEVDRAVLDDLGAQVDVPVTAGGLHRLSPFLDASRSDALRFRSSVVQETAYEGLPYRRRAVLHGVLGDLLEERAGERPEEVAGLLALHFSHAQRPSAAWRHAVVGAARAAAISAHAEAAELSERALAAARSLDVGDGLAAVWEGLGDARLRLAQFGAASAAYAAARRCAGAEGTDLARLHLKAAVCAERSGGYAQALRWSSSARRLLGDAADGPSRRLAAEALVVRATVRHWQGRHREAAAEAKGASTLATAAGALDVAAEALVWLDVSELMLGEGSGAHAEQARVVLERLGDRPWQLGRCLNELGIRAWYAGDWDAARRSYELCRASFAEAGDAWAASLAQANEAEVLLDQGHLAQAEPLLRSALRAARASAAPGHTAFVLGLLGRLEARGGRSELALAHLEEALRLFEGVGEADEAREVRLRIAQCRVLTGDADGALGDLAAVEARQASRPGPLHLRVRGLALELAGRPDEARTALDEAIAAARRTGSDHDVAVGLAALAWWHVGRGTPLAAEAAAEQTSLLGRLGIVDVPLPERRPR